MGLTIIEKIISNHTDGDVKPGNIVWMDLDVRSARDFGGPNVVHHYRGEYGTIPLENKGKTFFTFDLCAPACSMKYADNQQICREFSKEMGMRTFDVDRGIGSHVLMEEGLAVSGGTVVGTDSHMNILGAVGCFGQGMGDIDITFAFKTGKTWFEIPETIKVIVHGKWGWPATAKDLTLLIVKTLGTQSAALQAVEFYGEGVKDLSLAGRITLCSMVTEMAGIIGFVPEYGTDVEKEIKTFFPHQASFLQADEDAVYSAVIEIDADGLTPQVAAPFSPVNVKDIADIQGKQVDSGFIGSCTNGRLEDLLQAAKILKGKRIPEDVVLKVVPATRQVYQELLQSGVLSDLFMSGAIVSNPGCGGCAEGHIGLTGEGEVQVSTGNRNFLGKQGKGEIYLASPAVVAASCLQGCLTSPREV